MDEQRRALLQGSAGALLTGAHAAPAAAETQRQPRGQPGDFDFLAGEWRIAHRRRLPDGAWDTFEGEATCWTILGGAGSVEDLRIPARQFAGMGLRLLDVSREVWVDHWVNARAGVISGSGQEGVFINGVGAFTAEDLEDGRPVTVRGVWDRITPNSCRWRQGLSRDRGATWDETWFMDWTRA